MKGENSQFINKYKSSQAISKEYITFYFNQYILGTFRVYQTNNKTLLVEFIIINLGFIPRKLFWFSHSRNVPSFSARLKISALSFIPTKCVGIGKRPEGRGGQPFLKKKKISESKVRVKLLFFRFRDDL